MEPGWHARHYAGWPTDADESATVLGLHLYEGVPHDLGDEMSANLCGPFYKQEDIRSMLLSQGSHRSLLHGSCPAAREQSSLPPAEELSPGELRVLRYLPTNLSRPEIAGELSVSPNTVNAHIRSIYAKLGVRDRSSAVRRARELRLLAARRTR